MKIILTSFTLLLLLACNKVQTFEGESNAALMEILPEESAAGSDNPSSSVSSETKGNMQAAPKKIIKNGHLGITVSRIDEAQERITKELKEHGAFVVSENFRNDDTEEQLTLVIRVPNEQFDSFINALANGVGYVDYRSVDAEDVTEEYTDVALKLANKKIYLEKYRDLLRRSANTKDLLEIQEKIRGLEDEIEIAEGRLRYIDDRVNYSTLRLTISRQKAVSATTSKTGFGTRISDALATGWNVFVSFLIGVVSLWPFVLILPFLVLGIRKWRRRRKMKVKNKE